MRYVYIGIWVILLFLFAFFLASQINSFLPESVLRNMQDIKWAAGITAGVIAVFGAVKKHNNPNFNLQVYVVLGSLFTILALFADPPKKPSEEEINRLKKELAVVRDEKESLSKSLQEVAVNLSRSTKDAFELGVAALGLGKYKEALKYLQKAENENQSILEKQAEIFKYEGNALWELDKYEEALQAYDNAIAIKPDDHKAWSNKGVVFVKLEKYEEALQAYEKAIALKPDFHEAWYNKGVARGKLGKDEEALQAFDIAIALKRDFHEAWYNKGVAHGKLGKYEEALQAYDKAIALKPDDHKAWSNKGVALKLLGKEDEAQKAFLKAEELKKS